MKSLRAAPQAQHWLLVRDAIVCQGLLPSGAEQGQIEQLLAVTRANDEALRAYRPQAYGGDALLFCGSEGFAPQFGEPGLGWGDLVRGTHHTIMSGTGAQTIARRLVGR